jgi:hypothetical protein
MTKVKAFTAQRWPITVGDQSYVIVKGNSRYSRFYVTDTDGKYLSKRGASTDDGAVTDALHIYSQREL